MAVSRRGAACGRHPCRCAVRAGAGRPHAGGPGRSRRPGGGEDGSRCGHGPPGGPRSEERPVTPEVKQRRDPHRPFSVSSRTSPHLDHDILSRRPRQPPGPPGWPPRPAATVLGDPPRPRHGDTGHPGSHSGRTAPATAHAGPTEFGSCDSPPTRTRPVSTCGGGVLGRVTGLDVQWGLLAGEEPEHGGGHGLHVDLPRREMSTRPRPTPSSPPSTAPKPAGCDSHWGFRGKVPAFRGKEEWAGRPQGWGHRRRLLAAGCCLAAQGSARFHTRSTARLPLSSS